MGTAPAGLASYTSFSSFEPCYLHPVLVLAGPGIWEEVGLEEGLQSFQALGMGGRVSSRAIQVISVPKGKKTTSKQINKQKDIEIVKVQLNTAFLLIYSRLCQRCSQLIIGRTSIWHS